MNTNNILISTICFINRNKPGAEIYATFNNRLIDDVMNKTPFDIMITTNEIEHFIEKKSIFGDRIILREEKLENHRLTVAVFNQLLKFFTIKDIDIKYDWVLYLDCDAGFTGDWDLIEVQKLIEESENSGFDMIATRTNAIVINELKDHEIRFNQYQEKIRNGEVNPYFEKNLFSDKFIFYEVSSDKGPVEWFDAKMPSEHVFLVKNNDKLERMCQIFEGFCFRFESQGDNPITVDMEAFEIGVSAKLAGYNMGDFGNYGLYHVIKVVCNHNNWEKVKY